MSPIEWLNDNLLNCIIPEDKRKVIEFIFLWQTYNYTYSQRCPDLGDREGALSLANCPQAQRCYENQFKNNFITGNGEDFIGFVNIKSVHCCDGERDRLWKDSPNQRMVKYNRTNYLLIDFLKVVYQIRCNFIHGGKLNGNQETEIIDVLLIGWAKDCLETLLNEIHYFSNG